MKVNSIKKNVVMNIIYSLLNVVFPLITFPYVSRVLSTEGMGIYSFFSSFASYIVIISAVGISTYGVRSVAIKRENNDSLSQVVSELFTINVATTVIMLLLLTIFMGFIPQFKNNASVFILYLIYILSSPFSLEWFFYGLEKYDYITKRSLFFKSVSLIFIFLFVKTQKDFIIYIIIMVFSYVIGNVVNFLYAMKYFSFRIVKIEMLKKHVKSMLIMFASVLAINVYTNLDTIMLGFISTNTQVAYYSIAVKIKSILIMVVNSVSVVLLPRLSFYINNDYKDKYNATLKKSISVILMTVLPLTLFFMVQAKECVIFLGGNQYKNSYICLAIIMPVLIFSGISNITGNQILIPNNKENLFLKAVLTGAIIDIIFNAFFIYRFGAIGAAIATVLAEFTQMSTQIFYSKKLFLDIMIDRKELLQYSIAVTLSSVALILFNKYSVIDNLVIILLVSAAIFFGLYIIILALMKNDIILNIMNQVLNGMKGKQKKLLDKQKDTYFMIDIMKFVMAIIVISIHTKPLNNCTSSILINLYEIFIRQAVPFFFITSGFFLKKKMNEKKNDTEKYVVLKDYLYKIIKMYLVWTIIYLPFEMLYTIKEKMNIASALKKYLLRVVLLGDNYCSWQLWYLLATIYAIIIIMIFIRMGKLSRINSICIITMLCMIIGTLFIKDNYIRMLSGLLYILLGMIIAEVKTNVFVSLCSYIAVIIINMFFCNHILKQFLYILSSVLLFDVIRSIRIKSNILQKEIREVSKYIYLTHMGVWFVYDELRYGQREYGIKEFTVITLGTVLFSVICCCCEHLVKKTRKK